MKSVLYMAIRSANLIFQVIWMIACFRSLSQRRTMASDITECFYKPHKVKLFIPPVFAYDATEYVLTQYLTFNNRSLSQYWFCWAFTFAFTNLLLLFYVNINFRLKAPIAVIALPISIINLSAANINVCIGYLEQKHSS